MRSPRAPVVLLVEDEPLVARVLSRVLESLGCTVLFAGGLGAVRTLGDEPIDLALSDLHLGPRSPDGTAVLELVRARWPSALRVLISGSDDPRVEAARRAGIVERYHAKPLQLAVIEEILAAVRERTGDPPARAASS